MSKNNFEYASELSVKMKELLLPDIISSISRFLEEIKQDIITFDDREILSEQLVPLLEKPVFGIVNTGFDYWPIQYFTTEKKAAFAISNVNSGFLFKYDLNDLDSNQFNVLMSYLFVITQLELLKQKLTDKLNDDGHR